MQELVRREFKKANDAPWGCRKLAMEDILVIKKWKEEFENDRKRREPYQMNKEKGENEVA